MQVGSRQNPLPRCKLASCLPGPGGWAGSWLGTETPLRRKKEASLTLTQTCWQASPEEGQNWIPLHPFRVAMCTSGVGDVKGWHWCLALGFLHMELAAPGQTLLPPLRVPRARLGTVTIAPRPGRVLEVPGAEAVRT